MHILQVTRGAIWGGGERHVASLLEAFAGNADFRMSLAVFTDGPLAAAARRLGTPVHLIPKRFRGDPRPLTGLARLIRREQVDLVHTHMISGNFYGRLAARMARARALVTTLHYIDREALPFLPPLLQRVCFDGDIRMSAMCDQIVATSEDMRVALVALGLPASKLTTILNGINLTHAAVPADTRAVLRRELGAIDGLPLVGIVGRLVPVKNQALFLQAARRVLDSGLSARFVVVGDGPLRGELETQARELGLAEAVRFAGFRTDVMAVNAACDVCVLSSNSETSAYGVSEAMAMNRPVVATAVGGVPELITHGQDGWLCPARDAEALAEGIRRVLSEPALAARLGEAAGRKVREEFSLERMAQRLAAVYRKAMES